MWLLGEVPTKKNPGKKPVNTKLYVNKYVIELIGCGTETSWDARKKIGLFLKQTSSIKNQRFHGLIILPLPGGRNEIHHYIPQYGHSW